MDANDINSAGRQNAAQAMRDARDAAQNIQDARDTEQAIRDAALRLGYADARPVTGHPFDVWRKQLTSVPLGQYMSFEHDPSKLTGWPLDEITIWAAIAPTPPMADWPEGCGEIGGFYMCSEQQNKRRIAWEDAAAGLGYEIMRRAVLPERAAAIRAGLGVHGLNGLLITPEYGSFVNINILLLHAAPPPGARGPEYDLSAGCPGCVTNADVGCAAGADAGAAVCTDGASVDADAGGGRCDACVRACPTRAISNKGVNAVICLRNYMSRPETLPEDDYPKMGRMIQGCDICQRVCPANAALARRQPPADMAECMKLETLLNGPDMAGMNKYMLSMYVNEKRILSQAVLAAANTGRADLLPLVEARIGDGDAALDKMARWASERLKKRLQERLRKR